MAFIFRSFIFLITLSPLTFPSLHALTPGSYGFATWGYFKYPSTFSHFEYTNLLAPKGGNIRLGTPGSFDSLNPFLVRGDPAPGLMVYGYAHLMTESQDEAGSTYGYVAESIDVSPDKLSVTFYLRKDATFNTGDPITAEDIVFSFEALKKSGHPLYRSYYADVIKAEIVDPHTVRFILKPTKNRELPLILGQIPVLSSQYYKTHDFEGVNLTPPPFSGPYEIEKIDAGRSITYRRRAQWWGETIPSQTGHYNFDRITYDVYRDSNTLFEAFKAGKIDAFYETTASRWATGYDFPAVSQGLIKRVKLPSKISSGSAGLFLNTRRPLFEDRRVRQALTLAFNFSWVNRSLFHNLYQRNLSYFPTLPFEQTGLPTAKELALLEPYRDKLPEEVFTKPFTLPKHTTDQDIRDVFTQAAHLLQEAGWILKDGALVKDGKSLAFEILIPDKSYERFLLNFVGELQRLGIQAKVRLQDVVNYQTRVESLDYDVIYTSIPQSPSLGNEQRNYWGSAQADMPGTRNYAGIHDPTVDALIESLIHSSDYEDLIAHGQALDRILLWGYYMIPAWHKDEAWIAYWDKLGLPEKSPPYHIFPIETWWFDGQANGRLEHNRHSLESPSSHWWSHLKEWVKTLWGARATA